MKLTLAQINPKVGDLDANAVQILLQSKKAANENSDLIIFPECALSGYPPMDLLCYPSFLNSISKHIAAIMLGSKAFPDLAIAFGTPILDDSGLYNAVIVVQNGELLFRQDKFNLPNYDVFDEKRYFMSAFKQSLFHYKGKRIAFTICEDAWFEHPDLSEVNKQFYAPVVKQLKNRKPDLFINLSASPFETKKSHVRRSLFEAHAKRLNCPVVMVNQVGANDQLIFDGHSFILTKSGHLSLALKGFEEETRTVDIDALTEVQAEAYDDIEECHDALVLGINNYLKKSGFKNILIGLSGGIDSAVTAALAVKALGAENVMGIGLPSEFSSQGSIDDAKALAKNLGIRFELLPIHDLYQQSLSSLHPLFKDLKQDLTEENIQARLRGLLLMAASNKFSSLVLTTGNKSELAMGYCTLYGDMCGALAVLADVYKGDVYRLAHYINRKKELIPNNSITKEPSAELRPNQKDSDSLPDYDTLDAIISAYVDDHLAASDIVKMGYDSTLVEGILKKINLNEYKRQQAAPSLKISRKSFGFGRRLPIVADYSAI